MLDEMLNQKVVVDMVSPYVCLGTLVRADERPVRRVDSILLLGGVVGFQLPRLRPSRRAVERGDLLILAGAFMLLHVACGSRLVPRRFRREPVPAPAVAVRPAERPSAGRSVMNVFCMPTTSPMSPTR